MGQDGEVKSALREASQAASPREFSTDIPARLERLPWGRFHMLVVVALGITWILDGLEVTLAGSVAPALKESPALHFSEREVGFAGSAYLLGAVVGALFFGWLTDRLGRKKLFFTTIVGLPHRDGADRLVVERLVLLCCSASSPAAASAANIRRSIRPSRSWSRRALPRLTDLVDQRQLLDRRGARRAGRGRAARSGAHPSEIRMARSPS